MNITETIKKAISTEILWSNSEFYGFIECLEKGNLKIDFSKEDDEMWAQVTFKNAIIAYVWKKSPLVFIRTDHFKSMGILVEKEFSYIQIIVIDDLNANILSLDPDKSLTDRIRFVFDSKLFSANDFWFYNLT